MHMVDIVAEIGGNHLGSLDRAKELICQAAYAGADSVKFQCFTPEQMVGDPDYVLDSGPWKGRRLLELYKETYTPREWFPELFEISRSLSLVPFASVFHKDDVDFLETLDCPMYKISSFEANDIELIEYTAETGKQLVISTGMADEIDIKALILKSVIESLGIIFLKCTSAYPAGPSQANLAAMVDMGDIWKTRIGISDHTQGVGVAVAAVALGACMVEKHLNLDMRGPDAEFSMQPCGFKRMVTACRQAAEAYGTVMYGPTDAEKDSLKLRRSLWWAADLQPGDIVKREHIKCARPADGLPPVEIDNVIGKMIVTAVHKYSPISATSRHYE